MKEMCLVDLDSTEEAYKKMENIHILNLDKISLIHVKLFSFTNALAFICFLFINFLSCILFFILHLSVFFIEYNMKGVLLDNFFSLSNDKAQTFRKQDNS